MSNTNKFNKEEALNGKEIVTRGGLEVANVRLLKSSHTKFCLAGSVTELGQDIVASWNTEGRYLNSKNDSKYDLFMKAG